MVQLLIVLILFVIAALFDGITTYLAVYKYKVAKEVNPLLSVAPIPLMIFTDLMVLGPCIWAYVLGLQGNLANLSVAFWIGLVGTVVRFGTGTWNFVQLKKFKK